MAKKADKNRKKPSAPRRSAADKYKRYAAKPEAPKKSKKPLFIAFAAAAAVCVVFVVLLLAGVFSGGVSGLNGTWENDEFGYKLIIDGDRAVNEDGEWITIETEGDWFAMTYEGGERYEYNYEIKGKTLNIYETSDEERNSPLVTFEYKGEASLPESSSEQSSEQSSEPEPQTYDLDDGIPDFEQLGIANDLMREGVTYAYTTKDYADENSAVSGTLKVSGYEVTALTERALAFAEERGVDLTGYESRIVTVDTYFECTTPDISVIASDYYNAALFEDNFAALDISEDGEYQYASSKVSVNGILTPVYLIGKMRQGSASVVYDCYDIWEVLVPEGYDGVCVGYFNTQLNDLIPADAEDPRSFDYYSKGDMYYFRCA